MFEPLISSKRDISIAEVYHAIHLGRLDKLDPQALRLFIFYFYAPLQTHIQKALLDDPMSVDALNGRMPLLTQDYVDGFTDDVLESGDSCLDVIAHAMAVSDQHPNSWISFVSARDHIAFQLTANEEMFACAVKKFIADRKRGNERCSWFYNLLDIGAIVQDNGSAIRKGNRFELQGIWDSARAARDYLRRKVKEGVSTGMNHRLIYEHMGP